VKWKSVRDTLKNAFAMPDQEPLTDEEDALLEQIAGFLVRRRMTAPATFFLGSIKPLNFVGSQAMWILQPIADLFLSQETFLKAQQLLERRESIELLLRRIEEMEEKKSKKET